MQQTQEYLLATVVINYPSTATNDKLLMNDTDDSALFKESMKGVKPLKDDGRITPQRNKPKPRLFRRNQNDSLPAVQDTLSDFERTDRVSPEEKLSFKRPGVQHKLMQALQKGRYPAEADLDLHGMTAQDAKWMMLQFLDWANEEHLRTVCIIHGKGYGSNQQPVLKNKVNNWLRQSPQVIAFCSAQPKDGGTGAVYVRLKSPNITDSNHY